jgi:hypothetical protein
MRASWITCLKITSSLSLAGSGSSTNSSKGKLLLSSFYKSLSWLKGIKYNYGIVIEFEFVRIKLVDSILSFCSKSLIVWYSKKTSLLFTTLFYI